MVAARRGHFDRVAIDLNVLESPMRERLWSLWRNLFRKRDVEQGLDDELQSCMEILERDRIAAGVSPSEARRQALIELGGVQQIKEGVRETRVGAAVDNLRQDIRYAVRALRRAPGFTLATLLTLTLGIGANTAIFSMVNAVLLRPLPVREPGRLVLFADDVSQGTVTGNPFPEGNWSLFSAETYQFLQSQPSPMVSIAAFESGDYTGSLDVPGRQIDTDRVAVSFVSGNYFETLGAAPIVGRALLPADDRPEAPASAVASEAFWRERLDADPRAVGRTVVIDDVPFTIVGVMPRSFFGVRVARAPDVWAPLSRRNAALRERRDLYWLSLVGRLGERDTIVGAQTAVNTALRQFLTSQVAVPIDDDMRRRIDSVHVAMVGGSRGISVTREQNSQLLVLLLSAVVVILLIACANVGTLLLARAASREREVAVRRALGASRGRLIRQWLTESALLGGAGAVCGGVGASLLAPRLLATIVPASVPMTATIDGRVLVFTMTVTVLACLLFGLAPSLSAGRVDPIESLRLSGRSHRRRRTFGLAEPFVVVQIAMSLVLVVAAMLLVRTLLNLQRTPFGFDQERVLLVRINPRPAGYTPATVEGLYRRIHDRLIALPGVEAVSFARSSPFSGHRSSSSATIEGEPEPVQLEFILVGPNYAQTIGMPLVAGRAFTFADTAGAPPVALVNERFASRFFAAGSPLGRRVELNRSFEIVGVLKDAHFREPRTAVSPSVFIPMLQDESGRILDGELQIRTQGGADAAASAVRQAILDVDSKVTIGRTRTLRAQVLSTFGSERTAAGFIGTFAILALLVASVGLYGLVSHGLAARTNEIGVRVALGATRVAVVRLIARESLFRLVVGLSIGFVLAQIGGRLVANQLFGVTPGDTVSAVLGAIVLAAVVGLATLRPTLRALRVDPVTVLRAE
jgi:macrolide transport system ATP-binding/permease protein